MNKRLLIGSIAALAIGVLVFFVVDYLTDPARDDGSKLTEQDFHEAARKQLGAAALLPAGPAPIDPSRSVRLAIAGLGLATDEKNRRLADLITVELGNAEGLDLVERQSLDAVLK